MSATLEREIKLRFKSAAAARDAVLTIGATPLRGRRLQEDSLLDTDEGTLRKRRCESGWSRAAAWSPSRDLSTPPR
jgi:hypothetical protein